jgi:ankyrin repeat protein
MVNIYFQPSQSNIVSRYHMLLGLCTGIAASLYVTSYGYPTNERLPGLHKPRLLENRASSQSIYFEHCDISRKTTERQTQSISTQTDNPMPEIGHRRTDELIIDAKHHQIEQSAESLQDIDTQDRSTVASIDDKCVENTVIGTATGLSTLFPDTNEEELDDLCDLEAFVYDSKSSTIRPPTAESIPDDQDLQSTLRIINRVVGDALPRECTARTESSLAQQDRELMLALLRTFICRYAVYGNHLRLLAQYFDYESSYSDVTGVFKLAVDLNNREALATMLKAHSKYNFKQKQALLEYAAFRGRTEMISMIVATEDGVSIDGDASSHPLSAAIFGGHGEVVEMLLAYGADPSRRDCASIVKDCCTQNPVAMSAYYGHLGILQQLVRAGALLRESDPKYDALTIAYKHERPSMLKCLLESGVTLTPGDPSLESMLELGVWGDGRLIQLLLERGANPNTRSRGSASKYYGVIFQYACAIGNYPVVQAFLHHGVDYETPQRSFANVHGGEKPIYVAASCGHTDVVRLLLENGAQADILQLAVRAVWIGYAELLKYLFSFDEVRQRCSGYLRLTLRYISEYIRGERGCLPERAEYPKMISFLVEQGGKVPSLIKRTYIDGFSDHSLERMGMKCRDELEKLLVPQGT